MKYFAEVQDGKVQQVLVADDITVLQGMFPDLVWVETDPKAYGGFEHDNGSPTDVPALRKNYAGIGFTYDEELDVFIPPSPYPSWVLNPDSCLWEPPVPLPDDGKYYRWDESSTSWVEKTQSI